MKRTLPGRMNEIGLQRIDSALEDQITIGIPNRLSLCSIEDDIVKNSSHRCAMLAARVWRNAPDPREGPSPSANILATI